MRLRSAKAVPLSNLSSEAVPRHLSSLVIEAKPLSIYTTEAQPQPNSALTFGKGCAFVVSILRGCASTLILIGQHEENNLYIQSKKID